MLRIDSNHCEPVDLLFPDQKVSVQTGFKYHRKEKTDGNGTV